MIIHNQEQGFGQTEFGGNRLRVPRRLLGDDSRLRNGLRCCKDGREKKQEEARCKSFHMYEYDAKRFKRDKLVDYEGIHKTHV